MSSTGDDGQEHGVSEHESRPADNSSAVDGCSGTDAAMTAEQTASPPPDGPAVERRWLPSRQPARALTVVLGYLLIVGTAFTVLTALYETLGMLVAFFLAAALTVPLAVLAPRPRPAGDEDGDPRPVLLRTSDRVPLQAHSDGRTTPPD